MSPVTKLRIGIAAFVVVVVALIAVVTLVPAGEPPESNDPLANAAPRHIDRVNVGGLARCLRRAGAVVATERGTVIVARFGDRSTRIKVLSTRKDAFKAAQRAEAEDTRTYVGAANNTLVWRQRGVQAPGEQAALSLCLLHLS